MKTFTLTQPIIEKTFIKVGQLCNDDFIVDNEDAAYQFMVGFVDSLRKEASMEPSHALGFIKFLTEVGYEDAMLNKQASEEKANRLNEVFDMMDEKIAGFMIKEAEGTRLGWNPLKWVENGVKIHGEAVGRGATERAFSRFGEMATKAWDTIKSPEFLKTVAPYAIGALGGYVIPKLFGGGGSGNSLLDAGIGAALVGGGAHLINKYDLLNPEKWKKYKENAMNLISGGK
jgi:hypothetical protein